MFQKRKRTGGRNGTNEAKAEKPMKERKKYARRAKNIRSVTCRRADWTFNLKEVNLFVMVKKAKVVFSQYERSTRCCWREIKHRTHFPPFLLCYNLYTILISAVGRFSLKFMHHQAIRYLETETNLLIATSFCSLNI